MEIFFFKIISYLKLFWLKFEEAVFVTKNQYKLRLLHCYTAESNQIAAVVQVVTKRVKARFSIRYLACNRKILQDIHPVNACKISFIANLENEMSLEQMPDYVKISPISSPIIKQLPTLKITEQSFRNNETTFKITDLNFKHENEITANELVQNHPLLYALGSHEAARVGFSASNDFLKNFVGERKAIFVEKSKNLSRFRYFHILCIGYITLILAGISIVRRLFPFHVPFTNLIVPFGGGIIFFPVVFCIQDTTTEVYGYAAARQMVILSIFAILFYVGYSQLVIHLPTDDAPIFQDNIAFSIVFNTQPRQIIALISSLFIGSLTNDFFMSKSKVILAGHYLWARILGSTMIGEAITQIVGGVIGFSDKLNFQTQLLPNMILAYGYKLLWCSATIPLIYMVSNFLKKREGIDVFDYNADYNPFRFSIRSTK